MMKNELIIKRVILFISAIILISNAVVAADVAYIYKMPFKVDQNIVDVFTSAGLTVDLIQEKNIPRNFDNYKLIFVGDEKFTDETKIPVNKYPTIIANYHHAEIWGLTDEEGVSLLAQSSPLSVKKDGKLIQVYNRAIAPDGKAIQYYYLDMENVASTLTPVAFTEVTSSGSKFGDVIAYGQPGIILQNGKRQEEKLCFFGIIESKYWTTGGKNLFNDCVGFVASQCTTNADCSNETTTGLPFCLNGDVYNDKTSFMCDTQLIVDSCVPKNNSVLVEECPFGCNDGHCIPGTHDVALVDFNNAINNIRIENKNNTDVLGNTLTCNEEYIISVTIENKGNFTENVTFNSNMGNINFNHLPITNMLPQDKKLKTKTINLTLTQGHYNITVESIINADNSPSNNKAIREVTVVCPTVSCNDDVDCNDNNISTEDICLNPGTTNSNCVNTPIACFFDSDCGTNGYFGNNSCVEKNVTRNYKTYTCNNPGTGNSFCNSQNEPRTQEICNDICLNGQCQGVICDTDSDCEDFNPLTKDQCINPGTLASECRNSELNCASNDDCGFTGFIGAEFCSVNNVVKNFQNATCLNPGTSQSACSVETSPRLINQCQNVCSLGSCIRCNINIDCNDNNPATQDICNSPGLPESTCSNIPDPQEIKCSTDSQCGFTQILSQPFCSLNSVNQLQRNWKCNNPGTQQSFCESKVEQKNLQMCASSCSNGKCITIRCSNNLDCNDNNQNTNDVCHNPGTELSYCSNDNNNINCYNDLNCGTDSFISQNICNANKITRLFQDFTCVNPATQFSYCTSSISQSTIQTCDYTCSNGQCINPPQGECSPGQTRSCGVTNIGICALGSQTCQTNGFYANCVGNIDPVNELCDSKDNDCDGLTDENNVCPNPVTPQCNDGLDNDNDSFIDFPSDPGCNNPDDNDELPVNPRTIYQCDDGIDNDGDHLIDFPADAGCTSRTDNSELPVQQTVFQCNDNLDNDGDRLIDFPNDPSCSAPNDNSELPVNEVKDVFECDDGIDNDHDGKIDFPADVQCSRRTDNTEQI